MSMALQGRRTATTVLPLLLLLTAGLSAAQQDTSTPVNCAVAITQQNTTYTTTITCTAARINPAFCVVVQDASAIGHRVTYTYNGVPQTLGQGRNFTQDGSWLGTSGPSRLPALVLMGFDHYYASPQRDRQPAAPVNATLTVTASVVDVQLPTATLQAGRLTLSALGFSGTQHLVVQDSLFHNIASERSDDAVAAVAFTDVLDTPLNTSASSSTFAPSITVVNSTFSRFAGGVGAGALTLAALTRSLYGRVTVTNTTFTENRAQGSGASLYVAASPCRDRSPCPTSLTITDSTFSDSNSTAGRGGAVHIAAAPTLITASTFTGNRAGDSGGALHYNSDGAAGTLEAHDSTFRGNTAGHNCRSASGCSTAAACGGAVSVVTSRWQQSAWLGSAALVVRNTVITGNGVTEVSAGGAVCFGKDRGTSQVSLQDVRSATHQHPGRSTARFINATLTDNYVLLDNMATSGGAIFDFGSDGLAVDNCTFTNNTAGSGAAIYSRWAAYLNITGGTTVQNCSSLYQGGGAVAMSELERSLNISNADFVGNRCSGNGQNSGGAVWVQQRVPGSFSATIQDTRFLDNTCHQAGALAIEGSQHTIGPNVVFQGNQATAGGSTGGAVRLLAQDGAQPTGQPLQSTFRDVVFSRNSAFAGGAGLYAAGNWSPQLLNCSFTNNNISTGAVVGATDNSGGAAHFGLQGGPLTIDQSSFLDNTAFQGAALAVANSTLVVAASEFVENHAVGEGGAIRWLSASAGNQVNLTHTTFTSNRARTAGAVQLIHTGSGGLIDNCTFSSNHADLTGGAVSIQSSTSVISADPSTGATTFDPTAAIDDQTTYIWNSIFRSNFADGSGGGAVHSLGCQLVIFNTTLRDNNSTTNGGALFGVRSRVSHHQSAFISNRAGQGGAVYAESCNLTFIATQLLSNTGARAGGVLAGLAGEDTQALGTVIVEFTDCEVEDNHALSGSVLGSGFGGCVGTDGVNLTVRGGRWARNTAATGGGAIACFNSPAVLISGTTLEDNGSDQSGGAVFVMRSNTTISQAVFSGNSAVRGGSLSSESSNVLLLDTALRYSSAARGGAVFSGLAPVDVYRPGYVALQLHNCTAQNNIANDDSTGTGLVGLAAGFGGCISAENVNVTMVGGSWVNNTAAAGGGVIDARGQGSLVVQDVVDMRDNTALTGPGGAVRASAMANVFINNTHIQDNWAFLDGGCLWAGSSNCTLLRNVSMSNCTSATGSGGGAWVSFSGVRACQDSIVSALHPELATVTAAAASTQGNTSATSLLACGLSVSNSRANRGGGLFVQTVHNSRAVLDQLNISSCSADVSQVPCASVGSIPMTVGADGAGLYVATVVSSGARVGETSANGTSHVVLGASVFTANNARCGKGGAVAVTARSPNCAQVTIVQTTMIGNVAVFGGALSLDGPGASVAVTEQSELRDNTAMARQASSVADSAGGGGSIFAYQCEALLLSGSQLSGSRAVPVLDAGATSLAALFWSNGGGIHAEGCSAVVLDNASITNCTAEAGGGLAALNIPALLVTSSNFTDNVASSDTAVARELSRLAGMGGGMCLLGATASYVHATHMTGNFAGLLGGALASITGWDRNLRSQNGNRPEVPAMLSRYPVVADLAARAARGQYVATIQRCRFAGNTAQGSGGALFGIDNSSLGIGSCEDDLNSAVQGVPPPASVGEFVVILNISSCRDHAFGNGVLYGFGPLYASLPASMSISSVTPQLQERLPNTSALRTARLLDEGLMLLPATSPPTSAAIRISLKDVAGQDMEDTLLARLLLIRATARARNSAQPVNIFGQELARFDNTSSPQEYVFDGVGIDGEAGNEYQLDFNLSSQLLGNVPGLGLQLRVVQPRCGFGETIANETGRIVCRRCNPGFYALSNINTWQPAYACLPCPADVLCTGGAVMVPNSGMWHSSPTSTVFHQCKNNEACARDERRLSTLATCQGVMYDVVQLLSSGLLTSSANETARRLLQANNCPSFIDGRIEIATDPRVYANTLCGDGYSGNLCGVCTKNSEGRQTALRALNICGACPDDWEVVLTTFGMFLVNLLIILIQVHAVMGERMVTNEVPFADAFAAIITHTQFLILIIKLPFGWPPFMNSFYNVIVTTVSFASEAIRFSSVSCLSDGSPEQQAAYTVGGSLTLPLLLIVTTAIIWACSYYFRMMVWYPRLDRLAKEDAARRAQELATTAAQRAINEHQVVIALQLKTRPSHQEHLGSPETPGHSGPGTPTQLRGVHSGEAKFGMVSGGRASPGGQSKASQRRGREHPHRVRDADGAVLSSAGPSTDHERIVHHVLEGPIPSVDPPCPAQNRFGNTVRRMLGGSIRSVRRPRLGLRQWQLPEAGKEPEDTLWFMSQPHSLEADDEDHKGKAIGDLTLAQRLQVLDDYMPLSQQLFAIVIISCFVLYQGWVSAAMSVFNCEPLDTGELDPATRANHSYYATYQEATARSGYWLLNMDQPCYEGTHLTKWTPIGAVMSIIIGLGIPLCMLLPVAVNRKRLTNAKTQLRWGWLYLHLYYGRVPYWTAVQALELLLFIIVQTFSSSLTSLTQQAGCMLLTLVLITAFDTSMWPLVHPTLILMAFLSKMVLLLTLGLCIIVGDGASWQLSQTAAEASGVLAILINVIFVFVVLLLYYKHAKGMLRRRFTFVCNRLIRSASAAVHEARRIASRGGNTELREEVEMNAS